MRKRTDSGMIVRSRWVASVSVVIFLATAAIGVAATGGKGGKSGDPRFSGGMNDPRSAGAINRDSALDPGPAPDAVFPDNPRQFLGTSAVNNPGADATAQDTQSETTIATQGNNVIAAFNDSGSFIGGASHFTGFARSADEGITFTDRGNLPNSSIGDAGDPILATDDVGNVYMATLGFNESGAIQVFKSTDGGQTFGAPVNAAPEFAGTGDFLDKPWMAVNNLPGSFHGEIAVCYTDFTAGGGEEIRLSESIDGGTSWLPSVLINNGGQGCNVAWGFDPTGGNTLYVTYYQGSGGGGQGGDNKLFMNTYNETGASPHGPITGRSGQVPAKIHTMVADLNTTTTNGNLQLNGGVRSNSFPQTAVNPGNGDVIVTYNDDPDLGSNADNGDVYYVRSRNAGATWSAPAVVNNDSQGDQFFPSVGISTDGRKIMFGYYSRSHDPENLLFHRQGRKGKVNLRNGNLAIRPSFTMGPDTPIVVGQDPVINSTYMGDYDQIAATDRHFHSAWADNRDGNTFHQFQPDVRYARVNAAETTADLSVNVSPSATVPVGSTTKLTIDVTSSVGVSRDVYLNMKPVPGITFTSVTGAGCLLIQGFVNCPLGEMNSGTTRTVKVDAFAALPSGTRVVKAIGTTSSVEPDYGNDSGTATLTTTGSGTTDTYSSGNIAVAIPDTSSVDVPISVPDVGSVLKAQALVRLDHTFDSDLLISLVSPGGTVVTLSNRRGGAGDNFGTGADNCSGTPTTFVDGAATPIGSGTAPFAGAFAPDSPLSSMNGAASGGNWKLRVQDLAAGDTGTVGCFKLRLTHP